MDMDLVPFETPEVGGPRRLEEDSLSCQDLARIRRLNQELLEEQREDQEDKECSLEVPPPLLPANFRKEPDVASVLLADHYQRLKQGADPDLEERPGPWQKQSDSLGNSIPPRPFLGSISWGDSSAQAAKPRLPGVGEQLGGFHLLLELGRGAFARVFLAEQADLAGRPVVLKVSGKEGNEPSTLAQLQHTHVVPIYSVHEESTSGLRFLCMPYFGGASLSTILKQAWKESSPPTQGRQLVEALRAVQSPPPEAVCSGWGKGQEPEKSEALQQKKEPSSLNQLSGMSYMEAAAWVVARLAEGLQHAHQRSILHRDIKPSNVLLSADGQPMLLDFNLARNSNRGFSQAGATLGGTVGYMAPEHLRALAAPSPAAQAQVDHRSDIYSLGMVFFEMLTGRSPFDQSASYSILPIMIEAMALERSRVLPSARRHRFDVPWSLESIIRKCLAPHPAQRYQQAEHLAEDLQRFLDHRPLRHAPELSLAERMQKWVRRHPRLRSGFVGAGVLLLAVGLIVPGVLQQRRQEWARALAQQQIFEDGAARALGLVNMQGANPEQQARGGRLCREMLGLYQVLDREDWQQGPAWKWLEPETRQRLAEDIRGLLLMLAYVQVSLAPGDQAALQESLALLDRADHLPGLPASRALWQARANYLHRLGAMEKSQQAQEIASRTEVASAMDHYQLATVFAGEGKWQEAVEELDQSLALNPRHYWSLIQRGICYQELGRMAPAAADFGGCIRLRPNLPLGYFNQGVALNLGGCRDEAIKAYSEALRLDPEFVLAFWNRGRLFLELRRYQEALADFDQAQGLGKDDASLHAGRGAALKGLKRLEEAEAAFDLVLERHRREAQGSPRRAYASPLACPSRDDEALCLCGFSLADFRPEKADRAFYEVLRGQPGHARALYGLAMLAEKKNLGLKAIQFFDQALNSDPDFVEARRFRAVLLARVGRWTQAWEDIKRCLKKEPDGGATLYAAACVSALSTPPTATPLSPPSQGGAIPFSPPSQGGVGGVKEALEYLKSAFEQGYGQDRAGKDPDLANLKKNPAFLQLLAEHSPFRRRGWGGGERK